MGQGESRRVMTTDFTSRRGLSRIRNDFYRIPIVIAFVIDEKQAKNMKRFSHVYIENWCPSYLSPVLLAFLLFNVY